MEEIHELALFAGAGGGILGGRLLGWRTVCAVELDPYARSVLLARQADGCLDRFPIWDDVRTFDGRQWAGAVDVVSGGFPCQDISCAGKGAGLSGERSGLWAEMARIIREVRPRFVLVENSPMLTGRGLGVVLGDLAAMGFDAEWGVLGAVDAGAPHKRERIWILAYAKQDGFCRNATSSNTRPMGAARSEVCRKRSEQTMAAVAGGEVVQSHEPKNESSTERRKQRASDYWDSEPAVGRVVDGMAHAVDRLAALGNGQVPAVAALAWRVLTEQAQEV